MRPVRLLGFLIVALLLAGCADPPAAPPPPAPVLPALADHVGCPLRYPDGSPTSCDGATPLVPAAAVPSGWLCLDENPQEGWSFHWNPISGQRGLWYDVTAVRADNATSGVDGVLYMRSAGEVSLFNWSEAPPQGFLEVPVAWGANATFRFLTYNYTYTWFSATNLSATVDELWSLHDDQFWAVQRVQDTNGSYVFQNMSTVVSERRGADGSVTPVAYHSPRSYLVQGSDFSFSALYGSIFFGRSLVSIDTIGFDDDCTFGR